MSEFKDLEVGELEALLQKLGSTQFDASDSDDPHFLRYQLQLQKIKQEIHRRELEAARKDYDDARARYSRLYDFAPLGYAAFDAEGRIKEINNFTAALLGLERKELLETLFSTYVAEEAAPIFFEHIGRVLATGQRNAVDIQLCNATGSCSDVRLVSERTYEEGRPVCQSAIVDLTEMKHIEQEYRRSDDFSLSVLNALPAQLAVLDADGNIVATNEAWRQLVGQADAPHVVRGQIGMNFLQLLSELGGEVFSEASLLGDGIKRLIDGHEPEFKLEYACHTAEENRWFLVWATPMAGTLAGAVVAHVDITARVLAQEDARKRGEALARATRLSSVGVLASTLAHEITQPLTSVGQFSSAAVAMLYSGEAKPQELAEVLLHIDNEVQRAGEVIRRLRTFMGHGVVTRVAVDFRKILDAALGLVSQKLAEKKIDIILEIPEHSLDVIADQVLITQVLLNLMYNSMEAIDRAKSQERKVHLRCERAPAWVQVSVSDTGPGLQPEWRERIFDLFETDKARGTGMGLAICRSIIKEHGGRLWTESVPSKGAVFHFTLPITKEEKSVE